MKLKTQFTVPKKELKDFDDLPSIQILEETSKNECQDYPTKKDCIVCCN